MRPVEILALCIAGLATVKIVIIFIKPAAWSGVVRNTYGNPKWTVPIALVLAVIFLNILLKELTIVHIFGVMAFMMAMMMAGAAPFGDKIVALSENLLQDKTILKRSWLIMVVWLCLCFWVLYEIFT